MYLEGQERRAQQGFALAAMLVAIAIMSIMLMVALPTWRHQVQREKEAELIFRGEQYAHAIALYQRKLAGAYPPNLDILVQQKFLRKKYKDPITGEDFVPVYANSAAAMAAVSRNGAQSTVAFDAPVAGADLQPNASGRVVPGDAPSGSRVRIQLETSRLASSAGGIIGVMSKSDEQSIRLYNGRDHYNQWIFTYVPPPEQAAPTANPGRQASPGVPQRGRGRIF